MDLCFHEALFPCRCYSYSLHFFVHSRLLFSHFVSLSLLLTESQVSFADSRTRIFEGSVSKIAWSHWVSMTLKKKTSSFNLKVPEEGNGIKNLIMREEKEFQKG